MHQQILELTAGDGVLTVTHDPMHDVDSVDNVRAYDYEHVLDSGQYIANKMAVRLSRGDDVVATCFIQADGGASAVHAHSALVFSGRVFVAVGPYVACLNLPNLDLRWSTQVDDITCFGIRYSAKHRCLVSHGELLLARLSDDGGIVWQAGGADIFTDGFTLREDTVEAVDFEDRRYVFDLRTGQSLR